MEEHAAVDMSIEGKADSFGKRLRYFRRQCTDPLRGGLLTQDRLGELIGEQMGDAGYTGAAVSEWERDKSKIHADDRLVLVALLAVLVQCAGLTTPEEADDILAAGNYRRLNRQERGQVFGEDAFQKTKVISPANGREAPAPSRRSKQLILLEKVNSFWVEGVLQKSMSGAPLVTVPRVCRLDLVDHPWDDHLGPDLIGDATPLPSSSIRETFDRADEALLILGYPGSGKTTTLITLAESLIEEARADWTIGIPVILDLASWAKLRLDLAEWVVEELTAKYQIPRRYGRKWVAANELILLLDGLDTLPLAARRACIRAINTFRETHGLTGIAVCCRGTEYGEAGEALVLKRAVELQPLDDKELTAYFAQDLALKSLQNALSDSAELREMAHNPLMLNIMTAVYKGDDGNGADTAGVARGSSTEDALLEAYVRRSFTRHAAHDLYTEGRAVDWLSWLAAQLEAHNQTIFLIEQMQPSWLPDERWRRFYMILSGAITGLAGGLITWLLWRLLRLTLPQLPTPASDLVARVLSIEPRPAEFVAIILGNLALGLILGVTLLYLFEQRMGQTVDAAEARQLRWRQTILAGLETGTITFLFIALFTEPLLAAAWGVAEGFMYAAAARFVFGWSYRTEVRTVEALGWSWPHALSGVVVGLALAVVAEVLESLLYGYNGASRTVITLVVAGFVLGGLRGRSTAAKSRPNQGVWLSLRNAAVAALVLSLSLTALAWFIRDPEYAWQLGLLSAVIAAAMMGGSVVIKHFLLRAMLRYKGFVPWRYSRFLDHAAHLVLMRKVGGGYIYMHGLLQSYFARND